MNLFRRHKKFEEQLKEQLGDMEYKPSTSLWDRIDSDITKDRFETGVKSSLENFEQVPYSDTWDKIAAELPAEQLPNTRLKYFITGALAVLFSTGVWVGYKWNQQHQQSLVTATLTKTPDVSTESGGAFAEDKTISEVTTSSETKTQSPTPTKTSVQRVYTAKPVPNENKVEVKRDITQPEQVEKTLTLSKHTRSSVSAQQEPFNQLVLTNNPLTDISITDRKVATESVESIPKPTTTEGSIAQNEQEKKMEGAKLVDNKTVVPQTEVREMPLFVVKQDTTPVTVTIAKEKHSGEQEGLTRFSISILAGAQLGLMDYAKPKSSPYDFSNTIELRKQLERPDIDWSGGFLMDYRLTDKWMVSTGLMMTNFSQQFDYNTVSATNPVNPNETFGPVYTLDSVITGNAYTNRIKYSWTEIPVLLNYNIRRGTRWDLDIQAGASYAILNAVDAAMISYDNKGVFALKNKEAFPQLKNTVFVSVMPQVSYRFGQNVSVGFVPTFKYSVTSMIDNDRWVQQYPYFLGANICLRKRF